MCGLLALALCSASLGAHAQANVTFTINGQSHALPGSTPVSIDGTPAELREVRTRPNGLQANWVDTTGAAPTGVLGAPVLSFSYTVYGPVTANNPLTVLGQPVTVTGDTVLAGVEPPIALALGTPVLISGLVDANGSLLATLVERRAVFGNRFLLTGYVQELGAQAGSLRVGEQWVSAPGIVFQDCAGGVPAVGDYLEMRANAVASFPPGSVLDTVTDARCVQPVPVGTAGAIGTLQGMVQEAPVANEFMLGNVVVRFNTATVFVFGGIDDIAPGAALFAEGTFADATHFDAESIEFLQPAVRYEVPVTPAQVTPGVSISPYGIVVLNSAQVRDQDNILANGLAQTRQVQVRGYLDRNGQAFALRVRDRGNPDVNDCGVRGPVQSVNNPLLAVQGLTIDTTGATFTDEFGTPMSAAQFFAAVQVNHLIDVSAAAFNGATRTLTGGSIVYIGAEPAVAERGASPFGGTTTIREGTAGGYAIPDTVFRNGFE
jgi:hypothetical protein